MYNNSTTPKIILLEKGVTKVTFISNWTKEIILNLCQAIINTYIDKNKNKKSCNIFSNSIFANYTVLKISKL